MLKRLVLCTMISCCLTMAAGYAADGEAVVVLDDQFVQVTRLNGLESCAFTASSYSGFEVADNTASMTLEGAVAEAGSRRVAGRGVKRISWEPVADGVSVELEFATAPEYQVINAIPGSLDQPGVSQVVAAFSFPEADERRGYPVMGTGADTARLEREDEHGTYELPKFPPVKYSDALVTLNVRNTDFRDVLWLLSEIGGVSIILDPYWDQEPTGSTRPPGGPGGNTGGGGSGDFGGGFRPGGEFSPIVPRNGTGNLTLNFVDVPFDTALELVLMATGLVKADVYPGR